MLNQLLLEPEPESDPEDELEEDDSELERLRWRRFLEDFRLPRCLRLLELRDLSACLSFDLDLLEWRSSRESRERRTSRPSGSTMAGGLPGLSGTGGGGGGGRRSELRIDEFAAVPDPDPETVPAKVTAR